MGFSLTDTGVSVTSGRGKNAVALVISFKEIEAWATRMRKDTRELWRLSYGRAVAGLKKKFIQTVLSGGGLNGVPKFKDFEDFTKTLRAKRGTSAAMGGLLADKANIVAFKRNGAQVIGWPDHMEDAANSFQEGRGGPNAEKWFTDPGYRRMWHQQGIQDIPRSYAHNPRMVIEPYFVDYLKAHMDEWARSAYFTGLAKLMQGKRDARFERANLA